MKAIECPYFDSCDAPICPLDENKEKTLWYSDEAKCKNRDFSDHEFIKTQKKVSKLNKKYAVYGFFTLKMLDRSLIVKRGLEGLYEEFNSNRLSKYEQNWILTHKGISIELKTEMIEKLKGKNKNEGLP